MPTTKDYQSVGISQTASRRDSVALAGQKERRQQIACSGIEDATMDKNRNGHVRYQVIQVDAKVHQMSTLLERKD